MAGSYGCTKQVCQLRDALADKEVFKRTNVKIVGVSPDSVDKQKAFVEKHKVLVSHNSKDNMQLPHVDYSLSIPSSAMRAVKQGKLTVLASTFSGPRPGQHS